MDGKINNISINRRLRPIRLAFLVKPSDKKVLRKVIQINTCLWGGRFNGIIPIYGKAPKSWKDRFFPPPPAKQILSGYIDAFEPDFIVATSKDQKNKPDFPENRILTLKDLFDPTSEDLIGYGIDVIELYSYLYDKEFQFLKRHPIKAVIPKTKEIKMSLFGATCFGEFPQGQKSKYLEQGYKNAFDAKEAELNNGNLFQFYKLSKMTPLRLGRDYISIQGRDWIEPSLFYMDGTSPLDLIDFWNLRAIGCKVLPFPSQWATNLVHDCQQFIIQNHRSYRYNKKLMQITRMICSRSSDIKDMENFAKGLKGFPNGALSLQHGYPRIWDEWARDKDHVKRVNLNYMEKSIDVPTHFDRISFPDLSPKFADRFGGRNTPRWINVINLSNISPAPDFASVIPPRIPNLDSILAFIDRDGVWSTREGIVMPCRFMERTHQLRIPTASKVFAEWMGEQGFEIKISSAGNIAFQIVRSLASRYGLDSIANEEILKLLNKMAGGTTEHVKNWKGLLTKLSNNRSQVSQRRLEYLLKHKVLQVGLQIQCPHCTQHTWYTLKDLADGLNCEKCLQQFCFPDSTPPKDKWYYRAIGPFSVKDYAQGGYCVSLVLRFFSHSISSAISWVPSFCLQKKGSELESDFGFFWQESKYKRTDPMLILGECKSYGKFKNKDIDRARNLATTFPGAIICFCTLRTNLENSEKKMISPLAYKGRKFWKGEKWLNPVLILTGTELFADSGPPSCWNDAGGKFKSIAHTYRSYNGIEELCDATQQLHLGMESYWEWVEKKGKRKTQQPKKKGGKRK